MKILELLFLGTLLFSYGHSEQLLHSVDGDVGRGNYSYYSLMYEGPITLYLYSTLGDADLYVSQLNSKPTFEPDTYCLQSSTCGLDTVHIPASFSRPVGIGVYGHTSYAESSYSLEVYASDLDSNDSSDSYRDGEEDGSRGEDSSSAPRRWRAEQAPSAPGADYSTHQKIDKSDHDTEEVQQESFFWTVIWSFFDILFEILFFT